jgi:hypothetical protein
MSLLLSKLAFRALQFMFVYGRISVIVLINVMREKIHYLSIGIL